MKNKENYLTKGERTMGFKIEKDKPIKESHYRTAFTQALNNLQVGDAITGLTKKQAYGFRSNFYTLNFRGCDDYYTSYRKAKQDYDKWIEQGYDDVHLEKVSE